MGTVTDVHTVWDKDGNLKESKIPFDKDGVFFVGLRQHMGIQVKISDQLNLIANAQTCYWANSGDYSGLNQANDFGLGFQYLFARKNITQ